MLAGSPEDETDEAAAAFGVVLPASPQDEQVLWADNRWAVLLFQGMLTQWRMGPRGPVGLDYGGPLDRVERQVRLPRRERRAAFDGLQVMEMAALNYFAELARDN
ncbi:MAG: hypothetical protein YHS30scaffold667_17 [Phage 65_10]|nr:MAG: hypothetical protein YHS30scaffold667_17 [Phage 65_10]